MTQTRQSARINVKIVLVLVVLLALTGGGLVTAHYVRKRAAAEEALTAARAAVRDQKWTEAIKQFRVYLSKYPNDPQALSQFAEINLQVRPTRSANVAAAIEAYRRLLRTRKGDPELCERLAKLYFAVGDYVETNYIARQRLFVNSSDAKAMAWQGRALLAQGKPADANEILTRFVKEKDAKEIEIYALLSDIALRGDTNSADTAFKWLDTAVRNNPQSSDALARRAKFYQFVRKDPVKARQDLEAAEALGSLPSPASTTLQPADPKVRLLLAEQWIALGELDRAEAQLKTIGSLPSTASTTLESITEAPSVQLDFEREDLALSVMRASGELALRRGDKQKALDLARRGLSELTENRRITFLGYAVRFYLAADKVEDARTSLEEYRKQLGNIGSSTTLGKDRELQERLALLEAAVANAEGKPYVAIAHLEEIVSAHDPQEAEVWKQIAYAYSRTGQERRSIAALEKYVSRQPDDWTVALELARLLSRNADWINAQKYAQMASEKKPDEPSAQMLVIESALRGSGGKLDPAKAARFAGSLAALRQLYPKRLEVRLLQALNMDAQGQRQQAVHELEQAIADCENPLPAVLQLIEWMDPVNKAQQGVDLCRSAIVRMPDVAALPIMLADMQFAAGEKDKARQTLEQAIPAMPPDEAAKVRLALVRLMNSEEQQPKAIELLRQMAAARADDIAPRLALLDLTAIQDSEQEGSSTTQAQHLVDEMRAIEGERGLRWRYEQARLLRRKPDWKSRQQEIIELLTRCINGDSGWNAPVLALGRLYELLGKDDLAEEMYRSFVEVHPGDVNVASRLIDLLERQGRFAAASHLLDATQIPSLISRYKATMAIGQGKFDEARKELQDRIAANPRDAASRVLLARLIYQQSRDAAGALKLLDEAHQAAPSLLPVISTRVGILHSEGKKDEALAVLNAEVKRRADYGAYLLRAEYYASNGQHDEAQRDYQHLITFPTSTAEGYGKLGNFYEHINQPDKAMSAYEAGLNAEPENADLKQALIRVQIGSSDRQAHMRGRGMLDEMLRQSPEDPVLLTLHAADLLQQRTPDSTKQAADLFERVVTLDPRSVTAHIQLIKLTMDQGELSKAAQLAARATGSNPQNNDLLLVRAGLESEMNNRLAARELAQTVLDNDPQNVPARLILVQLALRNGETDAAETRCHEALRIAPDHEEARLAEAQILDVKNQREEAIKQLEAYRQGAGSGHLKVILALADLYRKQKDFAKCEERIAEADQVAPQGAVALRIRMRMLAAQKRYDEMLTHLQQQMRAHPNDSAILIATATLLAESAPPEYLERVKPLFEQYLTANPKSVDVHLAMAVLAYQTHDMPRAEKSYRRLLEIDPYHREALNNLAWILSEELGKPNEALDYATKGVLRYPEDTSLLNTRGAINFRLDLLAEAKQDLQTCIQSSRTSPGTRARSLTFLGRIALRQGESGRAADLFAQALELERKSNVLTAKERTELEKLTGRPATRAATN